MSTKKSSVMDLNNLRIKRNRTFTLEIEDLNVGRGDIVCLVGTNGSGKTTLLEGVVGLIEADAGEILIKKQKLAIDNVKAKAEVGYIPDDDSWIIAELTSREYFDLHVSVYKDSLSRNIAKKNVEILAQEILFNDFDQPMLSLSHGNRKKVQIITALLHDPSFLVIDELRNGLDPIAIKQAEVMIKKRCRAGLAVLAATHDLWWAERFADFIVMINNGEVLLQKPTKQIVKTAGSLENKFMELFNNAQTAY